MRFTYPSLITLMIWAQAISNQSQITPGSISNQSQVNLGSITINRSMSSKVSSTCDG